MYINSLNEEYKMLSYICVYSLFIQTKINKQKTKQNCCTNSWKSLIYLLGGETANHVDFM